MPSWKHHLFVCNNRRPPGHPKGSCAERGSQELLLALIEEIERHDLYDTVKLNTASCLGPCQQGPTVVVYPEGCWYGNVQPADAAEFAISHLVNGHPVERLLLKD